jgi:hypothetical protein
MRAYVLKKGKIPKECTKALELAKQLFQQVPDREDGEWTCHGMVEALSELIRRDSSLGKWKAIHGYFTLGYRHSWLYNPVSDVILDPYPVACGSGPMLLAVDPKSPWRHLFITGNEDYLEKMKMILAESREILQQYAYAKLLSESTRILLSVD